MSLDGCLKKGGGAGNPLGTMIIDIVIEIV